jgi:hypothetical protein
MDILGEKLNSSNFSEIHYLGQNEGEESESAVENAKL